MKILENIKKNTIFLIIITVIILYVVLKDDFNDIVEAFGRINYRYILIALLFFFLSIIIKGYAHYIIINDKKTIPLKEAVKHNLIAQFFNGITPFATGGQPMEVYMLMEHGIPLAKATNQTVQAFIFYQIALVICGAIAVLYNYIFHIFPKVRLLQHLVLAGFVLNVVVALVLIMISYSKAMTKRLCKMTIWIKNKLRSKRTDKEIEEKFEDYYNGFQEMKHRKGLLAIGVSLNVASLLCLYIVPLFVLYSMSNAYSLSVIDTLVSSAYVYVMGNFIPVPGASGGIEYGFTQFFGNFIGLNMIGAVVLIWRFITYYIGIVLGAILFNTEKKVTK